MDLANDIIRETYRPKTALATILASRTMENLRRTLISCRRYELDESMSEFLAELATVPFSSARARMAETLSSLRHSARLPFSPMFIELDGRAFRKAIIEASEKANADKKDFFGDDLVDAEQTVAKIGYLLEQADDETVLITEFTSGEDEEKVFALPWQWAYRTDDFEFPSGGKWDSDAGFFGHGLGLSAHSRSIAVRYTREPSAKEMIKANVFDRVFSIHKMLPEFGGVVRHLICFLATLNDVPCLRTEVRPSRGYLARGQMRKYVEHTVLTLQLPRKLTKRTLAKRLIANARRRWHEVEPHWRITAKPRGFLCEPSYRHLWSERDETKHSYCSECQARRVWIVLPHGRGDASLGIVHHLDRKVTHG